VSKTATYAFRSRERSRKNRDPCLQVSRPRPRPLPSGFETETCYWWTRELSRLETMVSRSHDWLHVLRIHLSKFHRHSSYSTTDHWTHCVNQLFNTHQLRTLLWAWLSASLWWPRRIFLSTSPMIDCKDCRNSSSKPIFKYRELAVYLQPQVLQTLYIKYEKSYITH